MPRDFFLPGRSPVYAVTAAAATSHPLASAEALSVLRAGGSAADAAIAACAVQCVLEPHMTGIGGDCFALVKPPDKAPLALNASGWTPQALTPDWLEKNNIAELAETSALTVTIPGAVAGWQQLHRRYGRLPWRGLFQAAVHYAENGYPVAARVADDWARHADRLRRDAAAAAVLLPGGKAPAAGSRQRQPALAATLKQIAADKGESFYRGAIAQELVTKLNQNGAPHTTDDFAAYRPQWQEAIYADFRGWKVWECPPNGQGIAALLMLALMNEDAPAPLAETGEAGEAGEARDAVVQRFVRFATRFADITRYAYRWRDAAVGDSADNWIELLREAKQRAVESLTPPAASPPPAEHKDTVYLSVIDGSGLAVSFINSLFHPFGSGLLAADSGILLHNRGLSFSLLRGQANSLDGRKRPLHTIIPAIAEGPAGEVLSFGVMGGHYQAAGQAWFLSQLLDGGCDLQQALDAPRLFNYPDTLQVEKTLPLQSALADAGYTVTLSEEPIGGGQAVMRLADGTFVAASDQRKDGMAVGF